MSEQHPAKPASISGGNLHINNNKAKPKPSQTPSTSTTDRASRAHTERKKSPQPKSTSKCSLMTKQEFQEFNQRLAVVQRKSDLQFIHEAGELLSYICRVNPFYLLSAALILYAQSIFFNINSGNVWMNTCIPLSVMVGYTILMMATALFIVRLGKVWDDARSIILISLFLFMAISVGLDGLLMENFGKGFSLIISCLILIIILSEIITRTIPIKLPLQFRTTFYLILAVFYLYPCLPANLLNNNSPSGSIKAISWFPAISGLLYLTLLPIIRRGKSFFANNSTPWQWPAFPWAIFLVTGISICIRTYLMSLSFFAGSGFGPYSKMATGFGTYMLIPFFLCILVLTLEHYLVTNQQRKQSLMLFLPISFYLLASPFMLRNSALATRFFNTGFLYLHSPLLIAGLASMAFYLYSWIRKVKYADTAILLTVFLATLYDSRSGTLTTKTGIPVLVLWLLCTAYLFWLSFRSKQSLPALLGCACFVTGIGLQLKDIDQASNFWPILLQLSTLTTLAVVTIFKDKLALIIRNIMAPALTLLFIGALFSSKLPYPSAPSALRLSYLLALPALTLGCYYLLKNKYFIGSFAVQLFLITCQMLIYGYHLSESSNFKGSTTLFWGMLSFACAFIISLHKGGIIKRLYGNIKTLFNQGA